MALKMVALPSFEMSVNSYKMTHHNIPENLIFKFFFSSFPTSSVGRAQLLVL